MNERIKQREKQAWDYAYDHETVKGKVANGGFINMNFSDAFSEKFAELIVRECIGCCEQVISDPVPESVDTWLNGGSQCIDEIKQHFGLGMSVEDKKQLIKDLLGVQK